MASTYLTRAFSSSTTTTKATLSFWVKFSAINTGVSNTGSMLFQARDSSSSNNYRTFIRYEENATLDFMVYNSSGSLVGEYYSKRKFRDCNAWYHICYSIDTTLSTASDRLKFYVNGVRDTEFDTSNYTALGQNDLVKTTSSVFTDISRNGGSAGYYFNGVLSHYILTDGYVYQADTFGSTDSTTGEWKINTSPSVNYGTNGFWILKDGNSVTDSSPNSNNFTVGAGTLTKTEDCPSNVFATMNPLDNYWQGSTFSNGNNTIVTGSSSTTFNTSTLLMTSGKYYVEVKPTVGSATLNIGVTGEQAVNASQTLASRGTGYAYVDSGSVFNNGSSVGGTWSTYTNNDIIGIAINLDDEQGGLNKLYFSKNGVWQNGADPSTPSSVTGVVGITKPSNLISESKMGAYAFAMNETWNDNTRTVQWNFGNGYFGTTAVSSAGTNASNNGIFEYDVPTGFTALSTKGLNT